ncbi:MAG: hypothetical protein AAFY56_17640, partial [Pseudomonadota bacterium]
YAELDGSSVDDVVTISAQMSSGETDTRDVVINYEAGTKWGPNYNINWDSVTNIQDVAQVVDGTWQIDNGGLRPLDLGYDRVVAIGDRSWDNYELDLSITTHDLLNVDPRGRDGGGFALGMLWEGHTDVPRAGFQPKAGWEPGAAFFYTDNNQDGVGKLTLHPSRDFFSSLANKSFTLQEGNTYDVTMRVEQSGLYDRDYSIKIWRQGTAEPTNWTLQGTEAFDLSEAPATGSLYLNAHYFDVAFGDLTITEITGRDIVQGSDAADLLAAVDAGSPMPGQGEIDVLAGYAGPDSFIFGDNNGIYYDDGDGSSLGESDYGFVWDFDSGMDQIQLAGSSVNYVLTNDHAGLPAGTAIWRDGQNGETDELVAVLGNVTNLDLNSADFAFTDQGAFV